jgi:transposase
MTIEPICPAVSVRAGRAWPHTLERQIRILVGSDDPLLAIPGCGHLSAAVIRGESGDVTRLSSPDAFAIFAGIAPLPASSGKTQRVRRNRRGNRRVNQRSGRSLVWQAKVDPRPRAYLARKRGEGESWREALRCLTEAAPRLGQSIASVLASRSRAPYQVGAS